MEQLFDERLILREVGSGTRAVFENFLHEQNYTIDNFSRKSILSSFSLIETAVSQNYGISFVYESIIQSILQDSKLKYHAHAYTREDLATFQIKDKEIKHSFHYVFLKNTNVEASIKLLDE